MVNYLISYDIYLSSYLITVFIILSVSICLFVIVSVISPLTSHI